MNWTFPYQWRQRSWNLHEALNVCCIHMYICMHIYVEACMRMACACISSHVWFHVCRWMLIYSYAQENPPACKKSQIQWARIVPGLRT